MKIKWFRNVRFKNDWELNFIGKSWNFRIGRSQVALWHDYNSIFNFFHKVSGKAFQDPIM